MVVTQGEDHLALVIKGGIKRKERGVIESQPGSNAATAVYEINPS
jgi:hypothetical protein